jgi:hypothetical protein
MCTVPLDARTFECTRHVERSGLGVLKFMYKLNHHLLDGVPTDYRSQYTIASAESLLPADLTIEQRCLASLLTLDCLGCLALTVMREERDCAIIPTLDTEYTEEWLGTILMEYSRKENKLGRHIFIFRDVAAGSNEAIR